MSVAASPWNFNTKSLARNVPVAVRDRTSTGKRRSGSSFVGHESVSVSATVTGAVTESAAVTRFVAARPAWRSIVMERMAPAPS